MEIISHSHVNKTYFRKKGCALGLILKVRVFETQRWLIMMISEQYTCLIQGGNYTKTILEILLGTAEACKMKSTVFTSGVRIDICTYQT